MIVVRSEPERVVDEQKVDKRSVTIRMCNTVALSKKYVLHDRVCCAIICSIHLYWQDGVKPCNYHHVHSKVSSM